jgi:hypothetical protein
MCTKLINFSLIFLYCASTELLELKMRCIGCVYALGKGIPRI